MLNDGKRLPDNGSYQQVYIIPALPIPAETAMSTYHDRLGEYMQNSYDGQAHQYRLHDELHITGPDHRRVCSRLSALCKTLAGPLHVLDLGCGTGRHFHCLKNVASLTAVDVSSKMIELAKSPVKGGEIDIARIDYVLGDFYSTDIPDKRFGLVYSFGVFGNGCGLEASFAQRIFQGLRPGGCFFFDVPDASALPFFRRMRQRLRARVYHAIPDALQARWDSLCGWLPAFIPTDDQLRSILRSAGFARIELRSEVSHLPGGLGKKFECLAWKADDRLAADRQKKE